MKPAICIKNNDCVRACVASILEMEPEEVPHWFADVSDNGTQAIRDMQEWLAERGMVAACIGLPGDWHLDAVGNHMRLNYSERYYMLWCDSGGDHAVVGLNNEIVWNPAMYRCGIDGPHSMGVWIVWIIAKL